MTALEQLDLWVSGKSVHNEDRQECCPDFSCCDPSNLADEKTRIKFANAYKAGDYATVEHMLMLFLNSAFPTDAIAGLPQN